MSYDKSRNKYGIEHNHKCKKIKWNDYHILRITVAPTLVLLEDEGQIQDKASRQV